jgi:hypothetical protein
MNWLSGMLGGYWGPVGEFNNYVVGLHGTGDQWESSMIMLWDYMGVNGDK